MAEVESNEEQIGASPSRRWIRTAIALLCMFCLVVFILLVPIPVHGRAAIAVGDLAHAPLFAAITLGMLLMIRVRSSAMIPIVVVITIALAAVLFGIGIEFMQSLSGRMPTMHDAVSNSLGVIAAVMAYYAIAVRKSARMTGLALSLMAIGVLAYAWSGPLTVLADVAKAKSQFPTLAAFDSSAEFGRFFFNQCSPRLVEQDATDGRYAMEIAFSSNEKYPGARLHEIESDWSKAKSLELDLVLDESYAGGDCSVMIKVLDAKGWYRDETDELFWRTIHLSPGVPQHVHIDRQELINGPKSRKLELRRIAGIDLIAIEPRETAKIRVDAIRLVLK